MTREIDLNGRAVALVDDEDYERVVAAGPWYLHPAGYAQNREPVFMHRLILGLEPHDGQRSDHINGKRLDNRRCNLRVVTKAQNRRNKSKYSNARHSQYKGVSRYKRGKEKPWQASIGVLSVRLHLGYFATEEEAAKVYDIAARTYHGPFAAVNFPRDGERSAI